MESCKIIFKGEFHPNKDPEYLAKVLADLLKIPEEKADLLLNGHVYILQKNLTLAKAQSFHQQLDELGIITHIINETTNDNKPNQDIPNEAITTSTYADHEQPDEFDNNPPVVNEIANDDKLNQYASNQTIKAPSKAWKYTTIFLLLLIMIATGLAGYCYYMMPKHRLPNCENDKTRMLVKQIILAKISEFTNAKVTDKRPIALISIKDIGYDKDMNKYFCFAQAVIKADGVGNLSRNISYTTEWNEKKELYTEVQW